MKVLGIDIGGSAFKGAPVDIKTGRLLAERHRVEVKSPCSLKEGAAAAREIVRHFNWKGPVGIGFPGIIQEGRIGAVGNLGAVWEGQNGSALFRRATGCKVKLVNDADAAGLAEVKFGVGRGKQIERYAAASVRKRARLDWPEWTARVNVYLAVVERLCAPGLIIIGGGISKKPEKFMPFIKAKARVVPARLHNDA